MRNFLTMIFFGIILTVAAGMAQAGTISYDRYNNYGYNSSCTPGFATVCDYSGTWSYGNTAVETQGGTGSYNYGEALVTWINSYKGVTDTDASGTYTGRDITTDSWAAGYELFNSTTNMNLVWSSSYADSQGYLDLNGGNRLTVDVDSGFYTYYRQCDLYTGDCTQQNTWGDLDTRTTYDSYYWDSYLFGQFQNSGSGFNQFFDQFPNASVTTSTYNMYNNVPVPNGGDASSVPEPGTGVLFAIAGLGFLASRRRKAA